MINSNKKIVISAGYGLGNLGDEAICETIVNDIFNFNNESRVVVLVFDKKIFIKSHPSFLNNEKIIIREFFLSPSLFSISRLFDSILSIIDIATCRILILGGGGMIRNRIEWVKRYLLPFKIAQYLSTKTAIVSIGVDEISNKEVVAEINKIKRIQFVSVRDAESKKNFLTASSNFSDEFVKVGIDPVFHFSTFLKHNPEGRKIGINLTPPDFFSLDNSGFNKNTFLEDLAKILNELFIKDRFELVCLLTDTKKDSSFISSFVYFLNKDIPINIVKPDTPEKFLKEVSKCYCFIGMRMHSLIMSSRIEGLPILSIIYAKKVENIFKEIGFKNIVSVDIKNNKDKIFNFLNKPKEFIFDFSQTKERSYSDIKKIEYLLK